jgi:hypothetical protein
MRNAIIDQVPLPETSGATAADLALALENPRRHARVLQGLGATEARHAGSDNRNSLGFHKMLNKIFRAHRLEGQPRLVSLNCFNLSLPKGKADVFRR